MAERILVVEDAGRDQQILKKRLVEKGFEVLTAQNEREFWKHIWTSQVDLILFDVCLKNRPSANVYHALLDVGESRKIPVILKTGMTEHVRPVTVLRDDGYVFFPAPVDFERLYLEVRRLLARQRQMELVA